MLFLFLVNTGRGGGVFLFVVVVECGGVVVFVCFWLLLLLLLLLFWGDLRKFLLFLFYVRYDRYFSDVHVLSLSLTGGR